MAQGATLNKPNGHEQLTSITTSSAQSLTVPDKTTWAMIQAEGGDLRWRDDGTAPTSSVGIRLYDGEVFRYTGALDDFQVISVSGSNRCNVAYFKT